MCFLRGLILNRSPSISSRQSSQPPNSVPSPYAHHLPPPNLPPNGPLPPSSQANNGNGSLPPPQPRVTELPSILSSPRSTSPSFNSHHNLPPTNSLSSDHANGNGTSGGNGGGANTVLPPIPPARTSTPPYSERRPSIARPAMPQQTLHQQQQQQQPPPPSQSQQQQASPVPPANSTANTSPSSQGGGYRPLNVRDALTYLDQVKVRFSDQPDVYNRFLDIMKDFKSQA